MKRIKDETNKKPVVAMYYTYGDKIGGPLTYINTIIGSELSEKIDFHTCYQNKAPGGFDHRLLRDMVRRLRLIKPDIVHVQGAQSEGFYGVLSAKLAGCGNIVLTIHGFAHDDSNCKGVKHFLYKYLVEPLTIRMADKVFCVCKFASQRKIVKCNAGRRNLGYIHNPVPELVVRQKREDIRNAYKISDEDVLFCIASRLTKEKGFDLLADTIKMINNTGIKKFRLLVMGDGDYYQQFYDDLKEEIEKGQVIMIGKTDDVASYLSAADAFVFPSYHENLSIALLEACASGLPCVVGNVGGNAEVILDGKNGYVVDRLCAEEFVQKIALLINNRALLNRMQSFAKMDVQERFSKEKLLCQIQEVYGIYDTKR